MVGQLNEWMCVLRVSGCLEGIPSGSVGWFSSLSASVLPFNSALIATCIMNIKLGCFEKSPEAKEA